MPINISENLPKQLYRAEQVRALDRAAIDTFHIPGIQLMENAGAAVFTALRRRWPRAQRITVACGAGNNGGDGFVIARLAHEHGLAATVYMLADASRQRGDAKLAFEKLLRTPVPIRQFGGTLDEPCDVIVDALLGTGLSGEVTDQWKAAIDLMNHIKVTAACPIVAVDIPSGLHADTGSVLGIAVRADLTVTFIGVKQGLLTGEGPEYCGELLFDDLGVDAKIYDQVDSPARRITRDDVSGLLPRRKRCAHKGNFGHVLIIGGNKGMAGAALMAAEAALHCGAGLVSVATRPEHVAAIVSARPEIMCHGVDNAAKLKTLLSGANCIAIGPGLGQDSWARALLGMALETAKPLVVDADALNLLAHEPLVRSNWVITPHPGEAGRLLQTQASHIQQDRFAAVRALQTRFGGVAVLKGCGTLVCDEKGGIALCGAGNPGMAAGGMGDVLTGLVAGCIAQTNQLSASTHAAVYIHSAAADLAAMDLGERGLLATDLFPYIRQLVNPE
ncbi:MAG: NAD(P)H-hydrate dehydratase [Gammaproteobacteria bacterium]|nr:NAD(P)H-hydrate dehydratase [Gammaproteobacteria bacterium]